MLACDASHPFIGTKQSFPSRFRPDSYMTQPRDLAAYDTMFTETEAKDMSVKCSSSPTHRSNTPSPTHPPTDAPTQTQMERQHQRSMSPEDFNNKNDIMTSSPSRHSPVHTSATSTSPRNLNSDSHQMVQLLHQQRQKQQQQQHDDDDGEDCDDEGDEVMPRNNHHQYQHQQQLQEQQQQHLLHQEHQQRLQQSRQYSKDLELDLTLDKGGNYSDSDSSGGPRGMMEHDADYDSKRFMDVAPDGLKDDLYWEKRRRNNEAARRSREKRRMQDMVLEGRITCLESDNGRLRRELSVLKQRFNVPDGQLQKKRMDQEDLKEIPPPKNAPRMSSPMSSLSSSSSSTQASHHNSTAMATSNSSHPTHNISSSASRNHVESTPYTSPPPLLTVAGAIQMGMAVYPSPGPALPYFFTEASRMNQEVRGGGIPHGIPSLPTGHPHLGPAPVRRNATYPPIDIIKQEKPSIEDVRIRERSNSNVIDCRPSYQMDVDIPAMRRGSVGNYVQYGRAVSPSMTSSTHPPYPGPIATRGSNPGHFLPRPYDTTPYSQYNWSQRSPASSHSSDDYDEPLQLTVRRDSNLSTQSTHSGHSNAGLDDTSSRESDQGGHIMGDKHNITPGSPPASSFPLKLRHKLPSHDGYPKEVFPNMSPSAPGPPGAASQPSFPSHPFINGLAHLSDIAMGQNNPLSLIKKENFRQRRESNRAMARRNPLDQKYMDPKYLERRRRNNEAARKCRENRKTLTRIREVKSDYLENENNKLREELNGLQEEMKQLRELIEKKRIEKGMPIDDLDRQEAAINMQRMEKD